MKNISVNCGLQLLEEMCELMYHHHQMINWHLDQEEYDHPVCVCVCVCVYVCVYVCNRLVCVGAEEGEEATTQFVEIRTGLERFSKNIWDEIQRRVSVLLSSFSKLNLVKVSFHTTLLYFSVLLSLSLSLSLSLALLCLSHRFSLPSSVSSSVSYLAF